MHQIVSPRGQDGDRYNKEKWAGTRLAEPADQLYSYREVPVNQGHPSRRSHFTWNVATGGWIGCCSPEFMENPPCSAVGQTNSEKRLPILL